jgi:hypothetical protein
MLFAIYALFLTSSLLLKKRNELKHRLKRIKVLQSARQRGCHYLLTRDESWFDFTIDRDHAWIPDEQEVSTRPKRKISSPKLILTVFWSPLRCSLVELLPNGICFNARYFCSSILSTIVQNRPAAAPEGARRNIVRHFDNAGPHATRLTTDYMLGNQLARAALPAFSPGLAPLYFEPFGKVKITLMAARSNNNDKRRQGAMRVLNGILREELEAVVVQWLKRLDACIQQGGEYVE